MNSLRTFSSVLAAAGLLSLCPAGTVAAFGGGAGGGTGAGSGAGASGSAGGGGGHGGGISAGAASAGHAGTSGGFHAGTSSHSAGLRTTSTAYNGSPHYLPGGFTPNVSGALGGAGRPAAPRSAVSRPVIATQGANTTALTQSRAAAVSRPANAWTDSAATGGVRAADRQANLYGANQSANSYRQYIASGNYNGLTTPDGIAGSYLYPGAYGSALNSYYNGQFQRGALVTNGVARNFAQVRSQYDPYIGNYRYRPNGYYPYFGPYGYPFFGSAFGYGGYYGDYNGDANLTNNNVGPGDQSVATVDSGPPAADQPSAPVGADAPNAAPAPPANPDGKAASGARSNGPDSLIEAVQAELARRGYFSDKVNAMYGPSTREAIRRFQTDAGLAATGRINEATLHALELD